MPPKKTTSYIADYRKKLRECGFTCKASYYWPNN
jgi:hypothetical protein